MHQLNDQGFTRRLVEWVFRQIEREYLPTVHAQLGQQIVNAQQAPSTAAIYAAVAAILQQGANVTITANGTAQTITIAAAGAGAAQTTLIFSNGDYMTMNDGNLAVIGG